MEENPEYAERIKRTYAVHSDRMKENNPSYRPEIVEKIIETKRRNGTLNIWKGERGGNGKLTWPQILLADFLGWDVEIAISLGPRVPDYPTCYKVDVGNWILKIAVEVDGNGHNWKGPKEKDLKKTRKLEELGWKVLRFTNEEIMMDLSKVSLTIRSEIKDLRSFMILK
uniref:DUF559 domain-containing protein n=1 Tax=viral metagenome TaxID=1070528 RepID=A0A6M3INL9_9ZZZZ